MNNAKPTFTERLAVLRSRIREGVRIDPAELIAVQAQAEAEQQIADLAAEGERVREAERAEREKAARIATAREQVRELLTSADAATTADIEVAITAVETLIHSLYNKNNAVEEGKRILNDAGVPHADEEDGPVALTNQWHQATEIKVDGRSHHVSPYIGEVVRAVIAAANRRVSADTGVNRRLELRGGDTLEHKMGTADWAALPPECRP